MAAIKCPKLSSDDPHLRITTYNRTFESRVYFSCPDGYRLKGPISITCLKNNTWSSDLPECEGNSLTLSPSHSHFNSLKLPCLMYFDRDILRATYAPNKWPYAGLR